MSATDRNQTDQTNQPDDGDQPLARRDLLLCVTGGIACYKSADLASKLTKSGASVTVAMTENACRFVAPLTFQAVTRNRVFTDLWPDVQDHDSGHISLTERADLMIVAPATANMLGKIAWGIADDLVSTMAMSSSGACEMLVAPAMNSRMWSSPALQTNIKTLAGRGVHFIGPNEGRLACGTTGPGRMAEPDEILTAIISLLDQTSPKSAGT
ncbi:MAG: flavoprotein [Phycisphaerae bacterium]|jgi:phosphopantothenoylcysteine decarboxylase/phosphopantothenate--cysteine ligase|nr:flavoprotein [Phycisphaerae bacterium]